MKNKRFYWYCVAMLLLCNTAYSQIIIQGGLNASSIRSSNGVSSVETFSRASYHVGVSYKSPLNDKFLFNPGIYYSSKGGNFGTFAPDLVLNYIDIPFHFTYQKDPLAGFFAEAGPYLDILLSAMDGNFDLKDNYRNLDIGLSIGAGYDFGSMILGGRGQAGITNIGDQPGGLRQNERITNINGQLYLGFKIN